MFELPLHGGICCKYTFVLPLLLILLLLILPSQLSGFLISNTFKPVSTDSFNKSYLTRNRLYANKSEQYNNPVTAFLGSFLQKSSKSEKSSSSITKKKRTKTSIKKLITDLEKALIAREWFVTGDVDPSFFSNDFVFQDPDVSTSGGIQSYATGVAKIFSTCSRAEYISTEIFDDVTFTVTWRLSGKVNILGGLRIKPFIVYSDFAVDDKGLICFQKDRFSIPSYDILISALIPPIGNLISKPASPVSTTATKKKM